MKTTTRSNVITLEEARRRDREIPPIWRKVRGMLKGRTRLDPVEIRRRMPGEWGRHMDGQIPAIWGRVFGMMKGKRRVDPVKVQRELRREAGQRLRRQAKVSRKKHAARH